MKKIKHFILFAIFLFTASAMAQFKPAIGFDELMISAEKDFNQVLEARKLAAIYDLPHTIYLPEEIFIEAKGVENNQVVYSIINDMLHPFNRGEVVFWEEVDARFDLSEARVHWANKPIQNPKLGYDFTEQESMAISFVMVLESTNNRVMTFNYNDGSLINANYIQTTSLTTPVEPILTPTATIIISGQVSDNIVEFDTLGNFIRILYGGNTAVLDNVRGIELRPGTNSVVATVGSGANASAIPEFDLTTGNYLGNFIAPNTSLMNSPFDIIFRSADCLVAAITSNNIVRYDLSGNHLGNFVPSINFPEQLYETVSGNILAAGFSVPSGLYIYDSNGNQLNFFNAVTGLRGAFQLGNGNYMVTNGTTVAVLDQTTGTVVATPVTGVSGRFIREYDLSIVPVELTSFTANVVDQVVVLNWTTATEVNNQGFEILRSAQNDNDWQKIGYVPGFGTTTEPKSYSYTDQSINSGIHYYRLKQIDYDGSFTYSDVAEVEVSLPTVFSLEQNYPNPFNPATTIQFSVPVDAQVKISVYNLVGEKAAEVASGNFAAGTYKVNFNASTLTSGIYFYQLDATGIDGNTFSSIGKMTLLK